MFYLSSINEFIQSQEIPYVYILGDFNANLRQESESGAELVEMCKKHDPPVVDCENLTRDSYTFA